MEDNNIEDGLNRLFTNIQRAQQAMLKYDLAEGFVTYDAAGKLIHTSPEMLEVDIDDIFVGLEDVVGGINRLFGFNAS